MNTTPTPLSNQARILGRVVSWPALDNPVDFAAAERITAGKGVLLNAPCRLVAVYGGAVYPVPDAATYGTLVAWRARFYAVPAAVVEGGP